MAMSNKLSDISEHIKSAREQQKKDAQRVAEEIYKLKHTLRDWESGLFTTREIMILLDTNYCDDYLILDRLKYMVSKIENSQITTHRIFNLGDDE